MLRNYTDTDYENLKQLYMHSEWFGGQYNEHRDNRMRLAKMIVRDPESIILCEQDGELVGTVSLFEDGRSAWLYRFSVKDNDPSVAKELYQRAVMLMKDRGHDEVLVYAPLGDNTFRDRYVDVLGMQKGQDYTCYYASV